MRDRTFRRQKERKRKVDCALVYNGICRWNMPKEFLVRMSSTRKKCSCSMCGNYRKYLKGKDKFKIQERRQNQVTHDPEK